jgi:ribosomal protein L11 methyltransferase
MRAFVVVVDAADVDVASDVLWQLGVRAIEERSTVGAADRVADRALERVELWTAVGDDDESIRRAADRIGTRWRWRVEVVTTRASDASETWRDFAAPMWVDDGLVVVPAWQEHEFDGGVVVLPIEPGGAFGLGDHPTTLLSLRALRRHLFDATTDVLDVGCGTGVLSVAAAVLGARHVRAVDIASAAIEATIDNAARNAVRTGGGDHLEVDTTPIDEIGGRYDLVIANVLAPTLIEFADDLRRLTRSTGRLVISGVLEGRHDHVLAALAPMVVEQTDVLDGWAAVTLRHPD